MKATHALGRRGAILLVVLLWILLSPDAARAVTTIFFDLSQTTNLVATNATADTLSSEGYLFTFTRDKLFTGGVGLTNPIGRSVRIAWPDGLEAQAVTAGPVPGKARMDITRQDGQPFAMPSFTAKLLGNTAGAGAAIEVMPLLNGEDGLPNPVRCEASGYYGQNFTNTTPQLAGFDAYKLTLYVDFALMRLTVVDASIPPPVLEVFPLDAANLQLSWPTDAAAYALEAATNLPARAWSPVTNGVTTNADCFTVDVEMTAGQRWFRLRK